MAQACAFAVSCVVPVAKFPAISSQLGQIILREDQDGERVTLFFGKHLKMPEVAVLERDGGLTFSTRDRKTLIGQN